MTKKRGNKKQPAENKIRTREHIIADLSVNAVERLALLEGHRCVRFDADYGYDLQMLTFDNGAFENGFVLIQLKATDGIKVVDKGRAVSFTATLADLNLWYNEDAIVFLIVWDAATEIGYWLNVQEYLTASLDYPLPAGKGSLTVRLPTANVVDRGAIREFRECKNRWTKAIKKDGGKS